MESDPGVAMSITTGEIIAPPAPTLVLKEMKGRTGTFIVTPDPDNADLITEVEVFWADHDISMITAENLRAQAVPFVSAPLGSDVIINFPKPATTYWVSPFVVL